MQLSLTEKSRFLELSCDSHRETTLITHIRNIKRTKTTRSQPIMNESSNLTSTRVTTAGLTIQSALRNWVLTEECSHFVTLNFHRRYSDAAAQQKLRLWSLDIIARLFHSSTFATSSLHDIFRFIAFVEYTMKDEPHLHLLLFVDPARAVRFEIIASRFWQAIVPSGTCDVQRITQTPADLQRVASYATKQTNRASSNESFITSNMLDLPEPRQRRTKSSARVQ